MIYIIFRPINHTLESIVPLCLEFDKIIKEKRISAPVGWNIPPQVFQNQNHTLLTYLSRRGAEFGDLLIFPGKTGKPHHSLTINQVKRELYQFSGDFQLPVWNGYFPYHIDLNRPKLINYYSKKTVLLIEGIDHIYYSCEHGVIPFPLILQDTDPKTAVKAVKKNSGKPIFVLIEPANTKDLYACADMLEAVNQAGSTAQLPNTMVPQKPEFIPLENIRGCILPHSSSADNSEELPHSWDIIANMPGSVILEEEDMVVHFNKGNLNGILTNSGDLLPPIEAKGYVTRANKKSDFIKDSSFSFTGEKERGLRDRIALPSGNGAPPWLVIRDYYFDEIASGLHISLWWKAAKISENTEKISLLEVPITVTNDYCMFNYRDLHGEIHTLKLTLPEKNRQRKVMVFSGDRFSFKPSTETSRPVTFSFDKPTERAIVELKRLKKNKDTILVSFTPGGMYSPRKSTALNAIQERIDFRLNTEEICV